MPSEGVGSGQWSVWVLVVLGLVAPVLTLRVQDFLAGWGVGGDWGAEYGFPPGGEEPCSFCGTGSGEPGRQATGVAGCAL